jgi:putative sigma-54 modulation protein
MEDDNMKFIIRGKNIDVTEAIKSYIENKLDKLDKYLENPNSVSATVNVRVKGNKQIVEVTIPTKKIILRGEESSEDLYASIDLVSDKLERQIRKNKTKMASQRAKTIIEDIKFDYIEPLQEEHKEEKLIVKRKEIETKPMNEEEAVLQMELIGHEFYIFKNADNGKTSVVYKRKDKNYGIIDIK